MFSGKVHGKGLTLCPQPAPPLCRGARSIPPAPTGRAAPRRRPPMREPCPGPQAGTRVGTCVRGGAGGSSAAAEGAAGEAACREGCPLPGAALRDLFLGPLDEEGLAPSPPSSPAANKIKQGGKEGEAFQRSERTDPFLKELHFCSLRLSFFFFPSLFLFCFPSSLFLCLSFSPLKRTSLAAFPSLRSPRRRRRRRREKNNNHPTNTATKPTQQWMGGGRRLAVRAPGQRAVGAPSLGELMAGGGGAGRCRPPAPSAAAAPAPAPAGR